MTTTKRDWSAHDASVPFRCPVMARLNGTNRRNRRPHTIATIAPPAANDNSSEGVSLSDIRKA